MMIVRESFEVDDVDSFTTAAPTNFKLVSVLARVTRVYLNLIGPGQIGYQ